jgi:hypothetical protein
MKMLKWKKKEKKVSPSKKEDTQINFVEAQILVARARAYAIVYGGRKMKRLKVDFLEGI